MNHDETQEPYQQPVEEKSRQRDLDLVRSLTAALIINAEPNTCFDNVLRLILLRPSWAQGVWVEGWYVVDMGDEVATNEHAWIEMPDGRILDPTVVLLVPPERAVYYFTGIRRSYNEIQTLARQKDVFFPYVRSIGTYGEDGLGHPQYQAAHDAAVRKVHALSATTHPPKKETFLTAQDDIQDTIILFDDHTHE